MLRPLSARVGSGNEADGTAKVEGKAKGKAKAKAEAIAKAKAKGEAQGGDSIDASPMSGEPRVQGPRPDEPQQDSEGSQAEGLAQAKAQAKAKARAPRGAAGTFAGLRPPQCPHQRANFEALQQTYLQARLQALDSEKDAPVGAGSKRRTFSHTQQEYIQTMGSNTQELARVGVLGPERMRLAAADWKARIRLPLKGDGAKAKSEVVEAEAKPRVPLRRTMHKGALCVGCYVR